MKHQAFLAMTVVLGLGLLLGLLVAVSPPSPVSLAAPAASTRHVIPGGSTSGECDSWANACELQTALSVAVSGDVIWVAAGTYTPTWQFDGDPRSATFQMENGVAIYGGFAATETLRTQRDWAAHVTILSGDIGAEGNPADNSYHVFYHPAGTNLDGTAILDGLTITGGNANGGAWPHWDGGGMYNSGSSPTLSNCAFTGNRGNHGSGMYNHDASFPVLTNCLFANNQADVVGGGMLNYASSPVLTNVTFSGNQTPGHGGGMYNENSSPTLTDCQFTNNEADSDSAGGGDGGGMYNEVNSSPVLSATHFYTNTANSGGGMHNGIGSDPALTNVTFSDNSATGDGGGMHNYPDSSPELTNVAFISNTAGGDGGGMVNAINGYPMLTNVTFSGNAAQHGGGMHNVESTPTLSNCILWGNTATTSGDQIFNNTSTPDIAWSDIQGSGGSLDWDTSLGTDGGGNIDADPLFVDAAAGDLHLRLDSPAVDRGNNEYVTVTTDLDGTPRIGNGRVDMGAYEFQYPVPPSPIYVDAGATGARDGSDWPDALTSLRFALAWAGVGVSDVQIRVAEGTYKPDLGADREGTFRLHSGVAVYGGFPPGGGSWAVRDWQTYTTTLSGDLLGDDDADFENYDENSYHVVTGSGTDASAVLDGFTISGGNANVHTYRHHLGGGMHNDQGSPTLTNVTFAYNTAHHGGGMFNDGGSPTLVNVSFTGNRVFFMWSDIPKGEGGGMLNDGGSPTLVNVSFTGNSAPELGGGISNRTSNLTLTAVTFSSNSSPMGGGMFNGNDSSVTMTNCELNGNTAQNVYPVQDVTGGGMLNSGSHLTLTNVVISGNTAILVGAAGSDARGGGMYNSGADLTLTDVLISDNSATVASCVENCEAKGGGVFNYSSTEIVGTHVTITNNTADYGGGMANHMMGPGDSVNNVTIISNTATYEGGGMYNGATWPMLNAITLTLNTADHGGGMYNGLGQCFSGSCPSSPVLSGTGFFSNTAQYGGGMHNGNGSDPKLTDVVFSGNTALNGGGMNNVQSSPTLTDVRFSGNTSWHHGGGMYNYDNSSPTLTNCQFTSNSADSDGSGSGDGGGMYNEVNSSPVLSGTGFFSNTAEYGGGMYNGDSSPKGKRITFTHNSATTSGGGMYNEASGPVLVNASFISNTATFGGGGMYNRECLVTDPELTNVLFNNNAVTGDIGDEGYGGGMYNEGCSPDMTNVTMAQNQAPESGGGMANFADSGDAPSTPYLNNSVLWGNRSPGTVNVEEKQVFNAPTSGALNMTIDLASTIQSEDKPSPFVDADGADDIPGTADDNLHPGYPSYDIIDGGDKGLLPDDDFDLDGNGNHGEMLPLDLDEHPRLYADNDLDGDPDDMTDPLNQVDQGAYEAGCPAWHLHYGADRLADGQDYRLGFHHEIGDIEAEITISDTLASYAAERAAGNLAKAKDAYARALDCASTVSETNQALAGLLKVAWEQATGALLEGNEEMVKALDLSDAEGMGDEIGYLEAALEKYSEATDGYLLPLAGEHQGDFLAAMGISRTHQITYTTAITQVDVQRLAAASAKKSRAWLELGERQFRSGDRALAEETLRQGKAEATVELALLEEIWAGVVEDVNYHNLLRNMSDMDRLLGFLMEDKNPLGYSPEWIPIHYRPGTDLNNYVRVDELAQDELGKAEEKVQEAKTESQKVHDNYITMQDRYQLIVVGYDHQLGDFCQPDLTRCSVGSIATQISAVEQAQLRLGRVLEQMNVLNKRIEIEVEAKAAAAGIYENITAELKPDPNTSERYSSMVDQEEEISTGWKIAKGVTRVLSGMLAGSAGRGSAFNPYGAVAGGLFAGMGSAVDMLAGPAAPPKEEKLLEFQVWQNAQMVICDGQIADVEFEKRIKELFLEYGLLDIDYAIALENLHEELLRLDGMKTRVEYLLAEKARALAFTQLLYQDPAHRVLRDFFLELAQDSYDTALDYTFRAGRALEYEANLTGTDFAPGYIPPDPDGMFEIRAIGDLSAARDGTWKAWLDWSADKQPQPKTKVVRLSRALNYEDTDTATAEEQFNAYVVRNPANRVTEENGAESLFFTFDTSIHKGNPFFDYCLFNDRIESVQVRIRGLGLGADVDNGVTVRLGWGDVSCAGAECGTTFIRSEKAFFTEDPDYDPGSGKYLDDLRAYTIQPKLATIQATVNDAEFPEDPNTDLALRSVACPYWTFKIPGDAPGNENLNLDKIDEIELIIEHNAYSLQAPMCQGAGAFTPEPSRPYRPMERVLDPGSSPLLAALAEDPGLIPEEGATSLSGLYAGTVAITSPQYMPALDMNLVLTASGSLTGYLDASQSLHVPVVDEATGHGPAVSGSWDEEGFNLESEVFTTTLGAGLTVSRQVIVHSGVISNSGEYLTGLYSETLAGLTPQPMVIYGSVELWRLPTSALPSASFAAFPVEGPVPLVVTFSDYSTGVPTAWAWDFGDGGSSAEQDPTYTYTTMGTYTVTLTATNDLGSDTTTKASYISVTEPAAPEASFSANPTSGPAPLEVTFTDFSSGGPTSWAWDFGDGHSSTAQNPVHRYLSGGSYTVILTATNALGSDTLVREGYVTVERGEAIYLPLVLRNAP